MRCAVKCGVARVEDFDPDVVEREGSQAIHIDPLLLILLELGLSHLGQNCKSLAL
jgi:hypothetical protein